MNTLFGQFTKRYRYMCSRVRWTVMTSLSEGSDCKSLSMEKCDIDGSKYRKLSLLEIIQKIIIILKIIAYLYSAHGQRNGSLRLRLLGCRSVSIIWSIDYQSRHLVRASRLHYTSVVDLFLPKLLSNFLNLVCFPCV